MSRRKLNVKEALELFENLPSGPESDGEPSSDAILSDKKSSDDDDDITNPNLPGPSRIRQISWKHKGPEKKKKV